MSRIFSPYKIIKEKIKNTWDTTIFFFFLEEDTVVDRILSGKLRVGWRIFIPHSPNLLFIKKGSGGLYIWGWNH